MPNPSGKNSPESFDEFAPTAAYGSKKQAAALQKSAPVAGDGAFALGSARRATEIALKSASDSQDAQTKEAAQQEPVIPPTQQPPMTDPYQSIWAAAASQPGASSLVREYASMT